MISVSIIGFGNLGQHLLKAFSETKEVEIKQVFSPSLKPKIASGISFINDLSRLQSADINIIAVKDDAVTDISKALPYKNQLVVHTSGTLSIIDLDERNKRGVFYPLQSISKDAQLDYKEIPICIEAEQKNDLDLLEKLATSISDSVHKITSEERKKLHLAAAWVNNFSNHLFHLAANYLESQNLSFDLLKPLIMETARKIQFMHPHDAQTGPARRNDLHTLDNHLEMIQDPLRKEIYKLLTKSIQKKFN